MSHRCSSKYVNLQKHICTCFIFFLADKKKLSWKHCCMIIFGLKPQTQNESKSNSIQHGKRVFFSSSARFSCEMLPLGPVLLKPKLTKSHRIHNGAHVILCIGNLMNHQSNQTTCTIQTIFFVPIFII